MTGESEKIAAALASIDAHGSLDQLAISTSAKAALVDFTLRQNLIAWSKRHGKYELTRLGRRRLAKGAVATPPVSAARATGIALAATLVVITGVYTMWPRSNPPLGAASRAAASLGSASRLSRPDQSPVSTTASPQDRDAQTSVQAAVPSAPADAGKATAGLSESVNFALPAATPPTAAADLATEAAAPEAEPKSEPEPKSLERHRHKRSRRERQDVADRDTANDPSGTRRSRSNSGERFGFFPFGPFSPDRRSARLSSPF